MRADAGSRISDMLGLETPPVALAFVSEPPPGIQAWTEGAPASCSYWIRAQSQTFFASADQHFNCPIGALTMGFARPAEVNARLEELVGQMLSIDYVTPEEVAKIPSIENESKGILYGPLEGFPGDPDLVLMWLVPQQGMVFNEASGRVSWGSGQQMVLYGRPACGALPVALRDDQPTLSAGCAGMRTFTEIAGDKMLGVVPGRFVDDFVSALEAAVARNAQMDAAYLSAKEAFASAAGTATD